MSDLFERTRLLVGEEGIERLANASVAVFGLGGVGGYALEALARAGAGRLFVVDADVVDATNLNRQILALEGTVGRAKVDVARERVQGINPAATVVAVREFLTPGNIETHVPDGLQYAIDAIDDVPAKVHLLATLHARGVHTVSCMGAALRLDPNGIRVADIGKTSGCPLARTIRQRLRKRGIDSGIVCVYSDAPPRAPAPGLALGSISYVPGIVGLTAAGVVISQILAR